MFLKLIKASRYFLSSNIGRKTCNAGCRWVVKRLPSISTNKFIFKFFNKINRKHFLCEIFLKFYLPCFEVLFAMSSVHIYAKVFTFDQNLNSVDQKCILMFSRKSRYVPSSSSVFKAHTIYVSRRKRKFLFPKNKNTIHFSLIHINAFDWFGSFQLIKIPTVCIFGGQFKYLRGNELSISFTSRIVFSR